MSDVVKAYYDGNSEREWGRLETPMCRLELRSTMRLIEKYFPSSGSVCDIGGGPGRYTIELLRRRFQVTLVDLSKKLLDRAASELRSLGLTPDRVLQRDAVDLYEIPEGHFDCALLLGPLYHLVEPDKRNQCLAELARVLRPGGVAIVAYLNSWGILRTGIGDFPQRFLDGNFVKSLLQPKTFLKELEGFTECYWSTPLAAAAELTEAGFEIVSYAGVEGFAGGMRPLIEQIARAEPGAMQNIEELAADTCELPQYRDATDHLCFVVRNAGQRAPG